MTASYKVLLVSENPAIRQRFEPLFAAKKYEIDVVTSGEDALWALSDNDYDAVLTDIELRGINGFEVAQAIQDHKLTLPVGMLSKIDSAADRERAAAVGAKDFLPQTQSTDQLVASINQIIAAAELAAATRPQKPKTPRTATLFFARVRSVLLFFLAPLISLVYIIVFPLVGLGMLGWLAVGAAARSSKSKPEVVEAPQVAPPVGFVTPGIFQTIGMIIAVVLIGFAYGIIGPVFGFILVVWFALEAWGRLGAKAIRAGETS